MLKYSTKHPETGYKITGNQQSKMTKLTTEELQDTVKELKEENRKLSLQVSDLWELLSFDCTHQIEALIELRGEKYVKDIFKIDYEEYQRESDSESDIESDSDSGNESD